MAFTFISAHDERATFTVEIPTQGKTTKTFTVPLMMFLPDDVVKDFREWSQQQDEEALIAAGERPIAEMFDWMMRRLQIKDWEWFIDNLVYGEKLQLWNEWTTRELPLGES